MCATMKNAIITNIFCEELLNIGELINSQLLSKSRIAFCKIYSFCYILYIITSIILYIITSINHFFRTQ